ncbi:MAG: serine/threonine protein kinase [Pyrinomonadaceae bacterium]|nr:serine/threonine protein kinase [Phycisphaerales bacterium]
MGGHLMVTASRLIGVLADEIVVSSLVPWPCPSFFGPEDRYRLEEVVAATAHSLLYRATDLRLSSEGFEATVAIKVSRYATNHRVSEGAMLRRVNHRHVLNVLDRGVVDDGLDYVVMEYVEGATLAEWKRPASLHSIAAMTEKIAQGVQAAHAAGVCHLDLKPGNILISSDGEPKVADFGLGSLDAGTESSEAGDVESPVARGGNLAFMAPEQFLRLATASAPPADIYALGGLLYWLLCDRFPSGDSEEEIAFTHTTRGGRPAPCRDRTLNLICQRALEHEPSQRHHSAGELADDLAAWIQGRPIAWTRPSLVRIASLWAIRNKLLATLLTVVLVALLGAGITAWWVRERDQQLQLQSESQARRMAEEQLESLKQDFRKSVKAFANAMFARSPANVPSSLVWLNWLTQVNIIDQAGTHAPPTEITLVLTRIIEDQEREGHGSALETLLAKHALAFVLVEQEEHFAASVQLKSIRAQWSDRLPAHDPFWKEIDLLDRCVAAMTMLSTEQEKTEAVAFLRKYLASSSTDGPAERLIREVLRKVKAKQAP